MSGANAQTVLDSSWGIQFDLEYLFVTVNVRRYTSQNFVLNLSIRGTATENLYIFCSLHDICQIRIKRVGGRREQLFSNGQIWLCFLRLEAIEISKFQKFQVHESYFLWESGIRMFSFL